MDGEGGKGPPRWGHDPVVAWFGLEARVVVNCFKATQFTTAKRALDCQGVAAKFFFDRLQPVVGGFAVEFGEVLHLGKFFDVLCLDLGDDRDERVDPRPIKFDADIWLEVDGYVEVYVLVPCGFGLISVRWDQVCWQVCVACLASQARSPGGSSVGLRHVDSTCFCSLMTRWICCRRNP